MFPSIDNVYKVLRALPTLMGGLVLFGLCPAAEARMGLVIGEPFGSFGTMMPVGHASIYMDHVCVQTPVQLRPCKSGEAGAVISRYHDLRSTHIDWMATPARVFFYGVEAVEDVPAYVTEASEAALREHYRQQHLLAFVPDVVDRHRRRHPPAAGSDWAESIGAAFDRRLLVYMVDTTAAQDQLVIDWLNERRNVRSYTLGRANCADFAADVLRIVLGMATPRNHLADFDVTSPKNLAHLLDRYGSEHPALDLRVCAVPQLPGSLRRSRPLRGGAEGIVKTKRYAFTLLVVQPEALALDWIFYAAKGRWQPGLDAVPVSSTTWPAPLDLGP